MAENVYLNAKNKDSRVQQVDLIIVNYIQVSAGVTKFADAAKVWEGCLTKCWICWSGFYLS